MHVFFEPHWKLHIGEIPKKPDINANNKIAILKLPNGKYQNKCCKPLPEEKKNTMEISEFKCMTCSTAITKGEYDTFGVCDACYDANYKKQTASGSVAAPKEELTLGVGDGSGQHFVSGSYDTIKLLQGKLIELESYRLSYTFEEDGETGLSLLDRLTPPGDGDISRGRDEIQLLAEEIELHYSKELACLRQHLKEREEALKELLPIAEKTFDSMARHEIIYAPVKMDKVEVAEIIEKARKLLSK